MDDLISRQAAISHVDDVPYIKDHPNVGLLWKAWIESLPSAQPGWSEQYKNKQSNCKKMLLPEPWKGERHGTPRSV